MQSSGVNQLAIDFTQEYTEDNKKYYPILWNLNLGI